MVVGFRWQLALVQNEDSGFLYMSTICAHFCRSFVFLNGMMQIVVSLLGETNVQNERRLCMLGRAASHDPIPLTTYFDLNVNTDIRSRLIEEHREL